MWRGASKTCPNRFRYNGFKVINDSRSTIGDQVIKKVASIKENTRDTDFIARYGGEEFVIICNNLIYFLLLNYLKR